MPLDTTGITLGNMINNAVQSVSPTSNSPSPIAASATAPNFAYSDHVTAQTTTFQTGNTYITIDYANPPPISVYTPLAYIFDQTAGLDGYFQLIPDGYYSNQANQAQQKIWNAVAQQIIEYFIANCDVTVNNVTGIVDSTGHHCLSGSATGTPTGGGLK
jgi:hypothetical protein